MNYMINKWIREQLCNVIRCPHEMRCNSARNDITEEAIQNQFWDVKNIVGYQGDWFKTIKLCNVEEYWPMVRAPRRPMSHLNASLQKYGENHNINLFWGPPFSIKHPQDNFSLQNASWHPPKCKLKRGDVCVVLNKTCRLEVGNSFLEGADLHFGGCQFTFWRLKSSLGCFIEKGETPKGW